MPYGFEARGEVYNLKDFYEAVINDLMTEDELDEAYADWLDKNFKEVEIDGSTFSPSRIISQCDCKWDYRVEMWVDGFLRQDALATLKKGFAYTLPNGVKLHPVGE